MLVEAELHRKGGDKRRGDRFDMIRLSIENVPASMLAIVKCSVFEFARYSADDQFAKNQRQLWVERIGFRSCSTAPNNHMRVIASELGSAWVQEMLIYD